MNPTLDSTATLVLLCKRPALGHSKQRLAGQIGSESALHIAQQLLACALEDLAAWPGTKVLAPDHVQHNAWGQALLPHALCLGQCTGNLGQRLNDLDARLRAQGNTRLIFIGSDCPSLTLADYRQAAERLRNHDSVLLMARDGGVVLMASNRPWPDLCQLPWSTPALGQALLRSCEQAGHDVCLAGDFSDVDHQHDLAPLFVALATETRPARIALRETLERFSEPSHA